MVNVHCDSTAHGWECEHHSVEASIGIIALTNDREQATGNCSGRNEAENYDPQQSPRALISANNGSQIESLGRHGGRGEKNEWQ